MCNYTQNALQRPEYWLTFMKYEKYVFLYINKLETQLLSKKTWNLIILCVFSDIFTKLPLWHPSMVPVNSVKRREVGNQTIYLSSRLYFIMSLPRVDSTLLHPKPGSKSWPLTSTPLIHVAMPWVHVAIPFVHVAMSWVHVGMPMVHVGMLRSMLPCSNRKRYHQLCSHF